MARNTSNPPPASGQGNPPQPDQDGIVQAVRTEVSNLLGGLFDSGRADVTERPAASPGGEAGGAGGAGGAAGRTSAERAADVQGQVQAAIGQLRESERRDREQENDRQRMANLEQELRKVTEKTPREHRPVEKFMGWHLEEED